MPLRVIENCRRTLRKAVLRAAVVSCAAALPAAVTVSVHAEPFAPTPGALVGWDTYRQLDRLPYLAPGVQTQQFSSYDRSGGNNDGGGGCLHGGGAGCVVAEDHGPGEIDSIWFTRDRGNVASMGNIRIELDGAIVLDAPLQAVVSGSVGAPFAFPLVADAGRSPGGVYIKVPMPYRDSMRVSIARNLQYYHVTYRRFPDPIGVRTFDRSDRAEDVLAMLRRAGMSDPKPPKANAQRQTRTVDILPGATVPVARAAGPGAVSALRLRMPSEAAFTGLRLRIGFDGRQTVDAPVSEFFGLGLGTPGAIPVRSLMFGADLAPGGWLSAWWPMPFIANVTVSLVNTTGVPVRGVDTDMVVDPDPLWAVALATGAAGHFSTHSHAGPTVPGQDWSFADELGHGKFVGVSHTMRGHRIGTSSGIRWPAFLEGNERAYVDGASTPQIPGTGTEDFYEGGWFFDFGRRFSLPLTGSPTERSSGPGCADYCLTAYRLMLPDAVNYLFSLRFGIQHGPFDDDQQADYSSTAFLYR
ncbi:glycoside hydrolase family 172 protein [Nocardia vaccinii]|uniref:glycoside hydrolase family 172 protein n=1 Tax=Nocardia vaccinii TaxID=1822 RepID=UPI000A06F076|nr:glycoside hydrolase family 172 protein [Nocardia vaccinii]